MNPQEMAGIIRDGAEEFEAWYKEHGTEGAKDAQLEAYMISRSAMLAQLSVWLNDRLYKGDKDAPAVPEGKALESYVEEGVKRLAYEYATEISSKPLEDAVLKYPDLVQKMIMALFSGYTGKKITSPDDDDGIYGEEAAVRHTVFDATLGAIGAVKSGKLKKEGCAGAFRALGDFIEKEL